MDLKEDQLIESLRYVIKAAGHGYDVDFSRGQTDERYPIGVDIDGGYEALWNPYVDDGDAHRLGIRLELSIFQREHKVVVEKIFENVIYSSVIYLNTNGSNREEVTRLAIVSMAVAIGKATPLAPTMTDAMQKYTTDENFFTRGVGAEVTKHFIGSISNVRVTKGVNLYSLQWYRKFLMRVIGKSHLW